MTEPVQFSDGDGASTTPPADQPVSTDATASARRGRPRSQDTLARDEAVANVLVERGPLTREELAAELNLPSTLVYLSLWRLKRDGRVERGSTPEARHAWRVVTAA